MSCVGCFSNSQKLNQRMFILVRKRMGLELHLEVIASGFPTTLDANIVLVVGKTSFTKGLGLEEFSVKVDKFGHEEVDHHLDDGIYAIGDVIPGPMLAYKAKEDSVACVELPVGKVGHVNHDNVLGVVYTHLEVASVGKTEEHMKP